MLLCPEQTRLASVRRSLFTTEVERNKFLARLMEGTRNILRTQQGLAEHPNYHEYCKLLGRLKTNYQVRAPLRCFNNLPVQPARGGCACRYCEQVQVNGSHIHIQEDTSCSAKRFLWAGCGICTAVGASECGELQRVDSTSGGVYHQISAVLAMGLWIGFLSAGALEPTRLIYAIPKGELWRTRQYCREMRT